MAQWHATWQRPFNLHVSIAETHGGCLLSCFCRRIRGAPAELTDVERMHYRSVAYGLAAAFHPPQTSLGRDRFHVASQGISQAAAQQRPLTPLAQAAETGRFAAGRPLIHW